MFVDVSATTRQGLDDLLTAILLTADASLDLRANTEQDPQGVVIEGKLDKGRGPVATVLVQRGTLRQGDSIVAGDASGRCSTSTATSSRRPCPRGRCRSSGSPRCPAPVTPSSSSRRTASPGRSPTVVRPASATRRTRPCGSGSASRTS